MATFGASKVASPALIDSGADVSVIPHHIFSQLWNTTLVPTLGVLSSFVGASANYVGYADINVHINKQISCPHRFYIMAETNSMNHVILGQPCKERTTPIRIGNTTESTSRQITRWRMQIFYDQKSNKLLLPKVRKSHKLPVLTASEIVSHLIKENRSWISYKKRGNNRRPQKATHTKRHNRFPQASKLINKSG